jgi:asparagine synthase (glutamine-hydrolysing)
MSGIAVLLRRDGAPADGADVRRMLARLAHRGPDGERVVVAGPLALAHGHFRTTPEETGEEQPIADRSGRYLLAMDGRVDNRDELSRALGLTPAEAAACSDAALLLLAFARWGSPGFARVVGSFAVAVWDAAERRLTLARDALGDRTLCWAQTPDAFVAASEEQALLAHPGVDDRLDERRLAQFFALSALDGDATFFASIKELLPGHVLVVEGGRCTVERYWEAGPREPLRLRGDREYAEAFRSALSDAVKAQTRGIGPVAVFLSGGLDSSSIAASAAAMVPRPDLKAVSWVFDELPSCDERAWIDPVVRHCGLEPLQFPGDGEWPFRDFAAWRRNPSSPEVDLYRRLVERGRVTARAAGARVVLSGMFGDHLYSGAEGWLWEMAGAGRIAAAARGAWRELRYGQGPGGLRDALWPRGVPNALRRLAGAAAGRRSWLTPYAAELLGGRNARSMWAGGGLRPRQRRNVLGLLAAHGVSGDVFHASSLGLEVRYPFRDRRLVELLLCVPSDQLYRPGVTRPVLREAMPGLLPEGVRRRVGKTSLAALFRRGVVERESETVRRLLESGRGAWERFVRPEWVALAAPGRRAADIDEVALSQCACLAGWLDK